MNGPCLSDREFALFQQLMYQSTGVDLADSKKAMVFSRLAKRLHHLNLDSFEHYFHKIASGSDPAELQRVLDLLTTHETYFFREPKHFNWLTEQVLPELRAQRKNRQALRIWSAASSTGEEAYSLAMVLMDHLGPQVPWEVFGSDISTEVIERARTGIYRMERINGLPPAYLRRFCLRGTGGREGTLLIDKTLRQRVRFATANLNAPLADNGMFDVIFLRNVLIYFDLPTKQAVVERVAGQLKPGGWLFVGHSESLNGISPHLQLIHPTIYRSVPS